MSSPNSTILTSDSARTSNMKLTKSDDFPRTFVHKHRNLQGSSGKDLAKHLLVRPQVGHPRIPRGNKARRWDPSIRRFIQVRINMSATPLLPPSQPANVTQSQSQTCSHGVDQDLPHVNANMPSTPRLSPSQPAITTEPQQTQTRSRIRVRSSKVKQDLSRLRSLIILPSLPENLPWETNPALEVYFKQLEEKIAYWVMETKKFTIDKRYSYVDAREWAEAEMKCRETAALQSRSKDLQLMTFYFKAYDMEKAADINDINGAALLYWQMTSWMIGCGVLNSKMEYQMAFKDLGRNIDALHKLSWEMSKMSFPEQLKGRVSLGVLVDGHEVARHQYLIVDGQHKPGDRVRPGRRTIIQTAPTQL